MASSVAYVYVDLERTVLRRIGQYEVVRIRASIKGKLIAVNYQIREADKS